jgi:hypothetical protein
MTSRSETKKPAIKRGRGRPKKTPVVINTEAIIANSEVKKLTTEVTRLKEELDLANAAFKGAELHIEKVEKQHKAALIVIGYLEGKIFRE